MQYYKVLFDDGELLLQEVFNGIIQRYCDLAGVTVTPPQCGSQNMGDYLPTFTPPPDPVAAAPVATNTTAPPDPIQAAAPASIVGAPLRVMTYDDKAQITRIDYPQSGIYQLLDYSDGRLRKITEVSSVGVLYERYFYYDAWGRFCEETQP